MFTLPNGYKVNQTTAKEGTIVQYILKWIIREVYRLRRGVSIKLVYTEKLTLHEKQSTERKFSEGINLNVNKNYRCLLNLWISSNC